MVYLPRVCCICLFAKKKLFVKMGHKIKQMIMVVLSRGSVCVCVCVVWDLRDESTRTPHPNVSGLVVCREGSWQCMKKN